MGKRATESVYGAVLHSSLKGQKKWKILKAQIPDYTCPTIDELYDYLEAEGSPKWTRDVLDNIRRDNVNLREVSKQAIAALKKLDP